MAVMATLFVALLSLSASQITYSADEKKKIDVFNAVVNATWFNRDLDALSQLVTADVYMDHCGARGRGVKVMNDLDRMYEKVLTNAPPKLVSNEVFNLQVSENNMRGTYHVVWEVAGHRVLVHGFYFMAFNSEGKVQSFISQCGEDDMAKITSGGEKRSAEKTVAKLLEFLSSDTFELYDEIFADETMINVMPGVAKPVTSKEGMVREWEVMRAAGVRGLTVHNLGLVKGANNSYTMDYASVVDVAAGCSKQFHGTYYLVMNDDHLITYFFNFHSKVFEALSCGKAAEPEIFTGGGEATDADDAKEEL